jgi:hypothetical protein
LRGTVGGTNKGVAAGAAVKLSRRLVTAMASSFPETTISHAFELWFVPEIERRRRDGTLPQDFSLWGAQVVMDPETPGSMVRLNEEIRGIFEAEAPRRIEAGEIVNLRDLGDIKGMRLTADDPNAGHLTVLLHKGVWYLFFDFRYNAARITDHIRLAREFIELAEAGVMKGYTDSTIDLLFSATEILAKSYLMMHPDRRVVDSKTHGLIATRFNLQGKLGNVPAESVALLNRMADLRSKARYPRKPFFVRIDEVSGFCRQARGMLDDLEKRRPKR